MSELLKTGQVGEGFFVWSKVIKLGRKKKLGEILKVKEWIEQRRDDLISEIARQKSDKIYDDLRKNLHAFHHIKAEEELTEIIKNENS